MKPQKIKRLTRFLKEKGLYGEFSKNFREQFLIRKKWLLTIGGDYCDVVESELINYAFSWIDTKQGHEFWENVSDEWKKKINEELRKRVEARHEKGCSQKVY
jgi:hypothetical protein